MFRQLLVKACKVFVHSADALAEGVGMKPGDEGEEETHERNIAWGEDFIGGALRSQLTGEPVKFRREDVVMLVAFLASLLLLRLGPVSNGTVVINKLVTRLAG